VHLIGDNAYEWDRLHAELAHLGVELIAPHRRTRTADPRRSPAASLRLLKAVGQCGRSRPPRAVTDCQSIVSPATTGTRGPGPV
jgi:hypothetical protein